MILGMAAPVFMLGLSANVDIEFDDFESVQSHPMAGPALVSFSDLVEGMLGDSKDALLNDKKDLTDVKLEADDSDSTKGHKIGFMMLHQLIESLELENGCNTVELKAHVPELSVIDVKLESEGLGKLLAFGMMSTLYKALGSKI